MKGIRLVGAIVVLLLALGSSIALAEQTEGETQGPGSLPPGAESLPERTANSETFTLPTGQLETRIYSEPVNYLDEEGNWQPIGERLRETDEQTLTNGPNAFDVTLPKQIDSKPVRFEVGEQWVESQLLRKDLEGADLQGAIATYEGEDNAPSFEFTGLSSGLKEDIELTGPGQANEFSYELSASAGLVPSLAEDGSIRFLDSEGTAVIVMPAPSMSDSAPQPAVSREVHYELGPEEDGRWKLSVVADREWLDDPTRIFPVLIDPTMTVGPDMECTIGGEKGKTGWINCAVWGQKETLLWYSPKLEASKDYWQRSLLELETTSIPVNSEVTSATFNIRSLSTAQNTKGVELRKVTKPWNWEASWSRYDGTHSWTTEGGDYSESLGEVLTATRGTQAGWWQFNLPAGVVEKEVNVGEWLNVMMKLIDDKVRECGGSSCTERKVNFDSSAATTEANRPYFSVVYKAPAPIVATEAATSVGETGATLKGQVNPRGYATTYQFEYGLTTSYGTKVPTTAESVGSGKTNVAVSKAISGLKGNTTYHYRVSATNAYGTSVGVDKTFTTGKLPTITTDTPSIGETVAIVLGKVNPNGSLASFQFEYGTTTSYGSTNPIKPETIGAGTSPVSVGAVIEGLKPATTYHYRIAATNSAGAAYSNDQIITTKLFPQTTITSRTPTYTSGETPPPVTFSADQPGVTFKCSLDKATKPPTDACTSPYSLPEHVSPGWHTFLVAATNTKGETEPTPAEYVFNPGIYPPAPSTSKMISPTEGEETASHLTLQAEWGAAPSGGGVTGVTFQYTNPAFPPVFHNIPTKCVVDKNENEVSWPLPVSQNPGRNDPVFFNIWKCNIVIASGPYKIRAVFDGGTKAAGASEPVATEVIEPPYDQGAPTDATQQVGPVNLDLLTGQFTMKRTDVSIPVPGSEANLEFTRTYGTAFTDSVGSPPSAMGFMWHPSAPAERGFEGEAWTELHEHHDPGSPPQYDRECEEEGWSHEECLAEEALPASDWIEIHDNEGGVAAFEIQGNTYIAPEYMKEYVLTKHEAGGGTTYELASPEGTHTLFTFFSDGIYRSSSVSWQATSKSVRMVYALDNGGGYYRLRKMIAPAPPGVTCSDATATETPGCRTLTLQYAPCGCYHYDKLTSITYYNSSGQPSQAEVVAEYEYDSFHRLSAEWDPRISPALKETYTYDINLASVTPPGLEPWTFEYAKGYLGRGDRLTTVKRPSLLASPATAQWTIAYEVPIKGSGAPYDMSAANVAKWGQSDFPVNATAIFPPSEVPSAPPSNYSKATITYMDPDGYAVNTASPQVTGASGPSITTSETDRHANVVRSLSAQNRLLALAAGGESAVRSRQLDEQSTYSADGTELLESLGPQHKIRLASGAAAEARAHTVIQYDQTEVKPPPGSPPFALPTTETNSARLANGEDVESKVTETEYDWKLLKPTKTIIDPKGLNQRTRFKYDEETGQLVERGLPGEPKEGYDAHQTRTYYYKANAVGPEQCWMNPILAGLPCLVIPGGQPGTAGQPDLLWTKYVSYNKLGEPLEIIESPGGKEEVGKTRKTITKYDEAGRKTESKIVGGGTELPPSVSVYSKVTGLPVEQKFTCESKCEGFDSQAVVIAYDELGRPEKYTDADGNTSETSYDLLGRPASTFDGKGTQTFGYDETSGLLVAMNDSAAGTFTASYDGDGRILEEGLPNGLVAKTTYDEAGQPIKLSYTKAVSCSEKCTWTEESNERSIRGQILSQTTLASSQQYSYDNAGRLTLAQDTPKGGSCTTRQYFFDADSNRTKLTTRAPGVGGACDTKSTGTSQEYKYDAADRLIGPEAITYDAFGRITKLPGQWAGGSTLETTFFGNNMVSSQSQAGLTNTYQLDAVGRPRQVTQTGTKTGAEVFHYSMTSDSTAWTERGATWIRSIAGISGGLAGVQESSGSTSLQLTNLHGDVVATASISLSAKEPTANFEFDEFGSPKKGSAGRYGWLGSKSRRTELPSGVIQMGVRSYVPAIGRFISVDPVLGGSANAYDYGNADPVNQLDLGGTEPYNRWSGGGCRAGVHVWSPKTRRGRRGVMYARIYIKCHGDHGGAPLNIHYAGWALEQGPGSGHIVTEHQLHLRNENTENEPVGWNNWKTGPPLKFSCKPGDEYQFKVYLDFNVGLHPVEEWAMPAQEVCGHGRY